MKKFKFSYNTTVEFSKEVQQHDFVLRCLPKTSPTQLIRARLTLDPEVPFDVQTDSFGNDMAVGTVIEPHRKFSYEIVGTATVDRSLMPDTVAPALFRYPTEITRMSPEMREYLTDAAGSGMRQLILEGKGAEGGTLFTCRHLMQQVHDLMEYKPGSTSVSTTAQQAFDQRSGVCQDFAHVLIALMRACNVPSRYVSGLTLGEGATHAWAEGHINGKWVGFDPTRNILVNDDYITLAVGRDWSDCPVERGTMQGFADQTQTVFMSVSEVE